MDGGASGVRQTTTGEGLGQLSQLRKSSRIPFFFFLIPPSSPQSSALTLENEEEEEKAEEQSSLILKCHSRTSEPLQSSPLTANGLFSGVQQAAARRELRDAAVGRFKSSLALGRRCRGIIILGNPQSVTPSPSLPSFIDATQAKSKEKSRHPRGRKGRRIRIACEG